MGSYLVLFENVSYFYFLLGLFLIFSSTRGLLVILFSLEVLFFSMVLILLGSLSFLGVYLGLLTIIFSGVLGLCLFIFSSSCFSIESSSSFLD